jgi:hypothetical protein
MTSESKKTAREMVEYAEILAEESLKEMSGEEAVNMVRNFCEVMAGWQSSIKELLDDPVMLGIHCLAVAEVFKLAFVEAYGHTSRRLDAESAIKKAFDQS